MRILNLLDILFSYSILFPNFLKFIKFDTVFRRFIILFSNIYVRIYFYFIGFPSNRPKINDKVIVSLTSFPSRINSVWLVIESMLRQSVKVEKIILWLSIDQFSNINVLPRNLLRLQSNYFEIRLCEGDLLSHKKYIYSLKEFKDFLLITIDDDILYPSTLLEKLINLHKLFPNCIICHRAKLVNLFCTTDKYNLWKEAVNFNGPTYDLFFTSGGGTLIPPKCLHSDVFKENIFMNLCKSADDIWLNSMAYLNKTKIVKSNYYSLCLPIIFFNNTNLSTLNIGESFNDFQLKNIKEFYAIN